MWQRPGEGPLVPLQDIVQVIDEYGKQNEWDKDPDGRYTMRPIQGATLPNSLRGYNLVATAETGSGKTMCFAVAALAAVSPSVAKPQVLISAHNRTLLDQLCDEMDKLCDALKRLRPSQAPITWSYVDSRDSNRSFNPSAHVILSTAGQLAGKLRKDIDSSHVKLIVADEVDDILNQSGDSHGRQHGDSHGRQQDPAMTSIIQSVSKHFSRPQVLLFSATIGDDEQDPDDVRLNLQLKQCTVRIL